MSPLERPYLKAPPQELRVFVSSTFHDLQEEREYLAKRIFPHLRELCRERGADFTEIDFRWGVTEEESSLGRTIRTCLEEIDRCRPFFIGILGDRYGWVPRHREIQKDPALLYHFPWVEEAVIAGSSIRDLEFSYGALQRPEQASGAFFYMCKSDSYPVVAEREKLERTRENIRNSGCIYHEFSSLQELGEQVRADFESLINRLWPSGESASPIRAERVAHEAFAVARRRAYISNDQYLERLSRHIESSHPPLIVWGESGAGKSSLMAYFPNYYKRLHPKAFTISHFIGVGTASSKPDGVLRHIVEEIKAHTHADDEIPSDYESLSRDFPIWLTRTGEERVIIAIDALNQLGQDAAMLEWLPKFFPSNIRLVISTTPGETLEVLRSREWPELEIQPLEMEEREALAVRFLADYHKGLSRQQLREVTSDEKCASPLFLKTMLEELRLFGSFEEIDDQIQLYLNTNNSDELFQQVLARMERDFGEPIVRNTLTLIWASRNGLSEQELREIVHADPNELSLLLTSLEYHLMSSNGLRTFFHEYLRRAVEARYLQNEEYRANVHIRIGNYFHTQAMNERRIAEEPWQWVEAKEWARLEQTVADVNCLAMLANDIHTEELVHYLRVLPDSSVIFETFRQIITNQVEHAESQIQLRIGLSIGAVLCRLGHYELAESILWCTLNKSDEIGGDGGELSGMVLLQLCELYGNIGEHTKLRSIHDAISRLYYGDSLSEKIRGNIENVYARILYVENEFEAALAHFESSLTAYEKAFGEASFEVSITLANVGLCRMKLGRCKEAEADLRTSLHQCSFLRGPKYIGMAVRFNTLGQILKKEERLEEAVEAFNEAIAISTATYGPQNFDRSVYLGNLSNVYSITGRVALARDCLLSALAIQQKVLPADSHWLKQTRDQLEALPRATSAPEPYL